MSDWYTVRFTGGPPAGKEPKLPRTWKDDLEVSGKLMELFGFEVLDDLTLIKEPPQLIANPDFESGGSWTATSPTVTATDIEGASYYQDGLTLKRGPLYLRLWERLRKWWTR